MNPIVRDLFEFESIKDKRRKLKQELKEVERELYKQAKALIAKGNQVPDYERESAGLYVGKLKHKFE